MLLHDDVLYAQIFSVNNKMNDVVLNYFPEF